MPGAAVISVGGIGMDGIGVGLRTPGGAGDGVTTCTSGVPGGGSGDGDGGGVSDGGMVRVGVLVWSESWIVGTMR